MSIDSSQRSRRTVLVAALGALGASVAGAIGNAKPTFADGQTVKVGASYDAQSPTSLVNRSTRTAVFIARSARSNVSDGSGTAITGDSDHGLGVVGLSRLSIGVVGDSNAGTGIQGQTQSSANPGVKGTAPHLGVYGEASESAGEHYGVLGYTSSPAARGIFGWSRSASGGTGTWGQVDGPGGVGVRGLAWNRNGGSGGYGTGIIGSSGSQTWPDPIPNTGVYGDAGHIGVAGRTTNDSGEHYGVYGESTSPTSRGVFGRSVGASGGVGMWGQTDGPEGVGVRGLAWNAAGGGTGYGTGVIGSSGAQTWPEPMANTGVLGVAKNGRGGVFRGDLAQVRLQPSPAATHPAPGLSGDLFVDNAGRLWFCKKGGNQAIWKLIA